MCVFTQRIAPTCALHHSVVLDCVIEMENLDKSCNFIQHWDMLEFVYCRLMPVHDMKYQFVWWGVSEYSKIGSSFMNFLL